MNPIQQFEAAIAADTSEIIAHGENIAVRVAALAKKALALSAPELEAWLNDRERRSKLDPTDFAWLPSPFAEFSAHAAYAALANQLAALGQPRAGRQLTTVDARPFAEKAAERGLSVSFDETGWHVTTIETQPADEQ